MEAGEQRNVDQKMIELDGTENKSVLGGNAILGVSLAVARAQANEENLPLYKYLRKIYGIGEIGWTLPKPMMVMIEGGKHADETTDLQEFMIGAMGTKTAAENVRMEMEIYSALKKILKTEKLSTNVGNEGAFAPNLPTGRQVEFSNEKPIEYLVEAIKNAGYTPGVDAGVGIDAAASEFFNEESKMYDLKLEGKILTSEELINYYLPWINKYPIVTMEDMLSEFDWENWPKLVEKINGKFPLIADDLTVTNTKLVQKAIDMKAATAILIKLNQIGSLTETIAAINEVRANGMTAVVSHRSGETEDAFIADFVVAMGTGQIKTGAPARSERTAKYNRLMAIEAELEGKSEYASFPFIKK
jgi:enolase